MTKDIIAQSFSVQFLAQQGSFFLIYACMIYAFSFSQMNVIALFKIKVLHWNGLFLGPKNGSSLALL